MPIPMQCKITEPAAGAKLAVATDVAFKATVKADDPNAGTLKYEWDFAGGSMGEVIPDTSPTAYKRPDTANTTVQFVRNNSYYRVRFAVIDTLGRRCEDAVEVAVGTPPTGLPGKVAEQAAPVLGSDLDGVADDLVVLPFEDWTMQNFSDMKTVPNGYLSFAHPITNVGAYVYRKARLPVVVGLDAIDLRYSAASNPTDPAGSGSINSTSQNWPLNGDTVYPAPMMTATIQKTDQWEQYKRTTEETLDYAYVSQTWLEIFQDPWLSKLPGLPRVDEGNFPYDSPEQAASVIRSNPKLTPEEAETQAQETFTSYTDELASKLKRYPEGVTHGSYMPGVFEPYAVNEPQLFPPSVEFVKGEPVPVTDRIVSSLLPITDIADDGRVNPYPLMRIEATPKGAASVLAATDGVISNSRDFHCRECHAKGKIGANPNAGYTEAAFHATPSGISSDEGHAGHVRAAKPEFRDPESDTLFDQEWAAAVNYSSVHQFYDGVNLFDHMVKGDRDSEDDSIVLFDWSVACPSCHLTPLRNSTTGDAWFFYAEQDYSNKSYDPNYSLSMHRFHGELQYNADKSDIVRDEKGVYKRFGWKSVTTRTPNRDINPNTLFPIFGPDGKQLPMEQNCLRCHAGHREQLYRDRMFTAGVSCYDCHGDMLAVGQAFTKDPAKQGSANRADYRVPWFDETDCGSCHVGNANVGKDGAGGYFSAGVMRRAFDETDLSAKTRPVDKNDPDAARFAVLPNYKNEFKASQSVFDPNGVNEDGSLGKDVVDETPSVVDSPLFRKGKDTHGNVACAACHGAAHAVWPNRDPNANDNVTALQLQGHTGTILECNVCHTADSFRNEADLDGGQYSGDPIPGILGGPHNTHPINDPYWWKEAPGDKPTASGGTKGGWHNNYAQKPDRNGKDQCAACHGADHKGTRLSKVPVDREFTDENGKIVGVKAGEFVGCDLCHRLEKSFTGAPK